jgi:3-oxoacyl-(acyl-carrier-protein) synthase/3-hydroxymyristoyl/3-hydroxydecanoyl-(acyl carrier protein) dehydratase
MYAVVGMEALLPGAPGVDAWLGLTEPQLREVPAGRWPEGALGQPLTTRRGAFVDGFTLRPEGLRPGVPFAELDPLFGWVAHTARGALPPTAERGRTALVLAALGLPSTGHVRALAQRWLQELEPDSVPWLRGGHPLDRSQLVGPALAAAAALGLGGPVESLDAACASGLYAVRSAMDLLASGSADCALAVAVNRSDSSYLFHGFSALRALSASGSPRPLDHRADGLLVGEGAAAVALKRLPDALRDGDRVHAVLRAVSLGSDGRKGNMLAPAEEGQLRALQAAWRSAGLDPDSLGLVECHATGTPLGDGVELRALASLLAGRRSPPVVLHAAKALIGHTVTAAGLAGLLRAVGAVRDGVLPAQRCEPRPELCDSALFEVLERPRPWEGQRRAAVSAFGFGGTNAHLIVDAFDPGEAHPPAVRPTQRLAVQALAVQVGDLRDEAWADLVQQHERPPSPWCSGRWREGRFRIPPTELAEMLPQQRLALELAADLLEQQPVDRSQTASVVGIEVDPAIGEAVVRWALQGAGQAELARRVAPTLSASRVQGCLPNFAANRIAAQLDLQGPSFVTGGGLAALRQAARLLEDPGTTAVVVGAVDLSGPEAGLEGDAGVMLLDRSLEQARAEGAPILAELQLDSPAPATPPAPPSGLGAADGLIALAAAMVRQEELALDGITLLPRRAPFADRAEEPFLGRFGGQTVPLPRPRRGPAAEAAPVLAAAPHRAEPLSWPLLGSASPAPAPRPRPPLPAVPDLAVPALHASPELARAVSRSVQAVADAHERFLDAQERAMGPLVALGEALSRAVSLTGDIVVRPVALPVPAPAPAPAQSEPPRSFDRAALLRHAGPEPLSAVFGERYRDLDGVEPRVRMPLPPLLLCDRVVLVEGERGRFGPSRVVTEYDVPRADWTADGRPPAFVVVESGQADLFLVSYLGIDAECRGERVYRLLDCDLEFLAPRPEPGTTLRHDIRIDRFARLGGTTLFYFHYDCSDARTGAPVLRMREGCAGFFTPAELSRPRGLQPRPRELPPRAPLVPALPGAPSSLDDAAVMALVEGHFSRAFGPGFVPADGSRLTLPPDRRWRLAHRVPHLSLSGGPHGLGEVVVEQDLSDDDWFNPVHFHRDPCMPGTLMLEGCLQAVQIWLLAQGVAATHPSGAFEVRPGAKIRLRCRGQVAPGHERLRYHARIVEAALEPQPYALADVVLSVDGVEVVTAQNVAVEVQGEKRARGDAHREPVEDARTVEFAAASGGNRIAEPERSEGRGPISGASRSTSGGNRIAEPERSEGRGPISGASEGTSGAGGGKHAPIPRARVLEFSIGSAARAFGPWYAEFEGPGRRCARMPGPPLLQMTEVLQVEGAPREVAADRAVIIAYDVPRDAWFWRADEATSMPFVILLETALQPCGWLTAWQTQGLQRPDLYFRNLGGTGVQHQPVRPDAGRLLTTARQVSVSSLGGMQIQRFVVETRLQSTGALVFSCDTQFGYFTAEALRHQKGLSLPARPLPEVYVPLQGHPALPRDDLRMLDAIVGADPAGGAAGLGQYGAVKQISPEDWYFVAHFWLDPVMPGSLGLEALLQLARVVLHERTGHSGPFEVLALDREVQWTYRGQVRQSTRQMQVALEVLSLQDGLLLCTGAIRSDGLPIYQFERFGVRVVPPVPALLPPPREVRRQPAAALLDTFEVQADHGIGTLALDPAQHPWLDAHRPTLTAAAVPLAFVAELAAEAAARLSRPGERVVGLPSVQIDRWIQERDGTLTVVAVREGDHVAVSLAVGAEVRARAIVELGERYAEPEPPLPLPEERVDIDGASFFASGLTFHGELLQAMTRLERLGPQGARAYLQTRPDAQLLGVPGVSFELDPLLLDAATHPMCSGEPERWVAGLGPGRLAYPVRIEGLRLHGPRPDGEVEVRLALLPGEPRSLGFAVQLAGAAGPWCSYRWHEVLVPGGPVLGQPAAVRRRFLWDRQGDPRVTIGRSLPGRGWQVRAGDLVEPLAGTLDGLYGARGPAQIAAKELVREEVRAALGVEVHPLDIELVELRPGWLLVTELASLRADQYVALLHPTRFAVRVEREGPVTEVRAALLEA